jgi:hypothetical protein
MRVSINWYSSVVKKLRGFEALQRTGPLTITISPVFVNNGLRKQPDNRPPV